MKQATFLRATIFTTDGAESQVVIGLCDRVAAQTKFGQTLQDLETSEPMLAEQWMAFTAYKAVMRQTGGKQTFEKWLETFLGVEFDDGAPDTGTTPA